MPVARTDNSLRLVQHIIEFLLLFGCDLFPVYKHTVSRAHPLPHLRGDFPVLAAP